MKKIAVFLLTILTIIIVTLFVFALSYADYSSKINEPNIEYEKEQYQLDLLFKKRYKNATMSERQMLFDSIYREEIFYLDTLQILKKYNCSLKDSINSDVKDELIKIIKSDKEIYGISGQLLDKLISEKKISLSVHFSANCTEDVTVSLVSIISNNIKLDLTIFIEQSVRKMYISEAWIEEHPIHFEPFPKLTAQQSMKLSNLYFLRSIKENPYWENFFKDKIPVKIGRNLNGLNENIYAYRCQFKDNRPLKELKAYYW